MATFIKLQDSPMFRKQLSSFETTTNELKDRCLKLQKGCNKYMASLEEAYDGDLAFAESLEAFGGGQDDPVSVSIGGPVITKFITAFRELGTYKELLRSQVEHMLSDRLMQFIMGDLQDAKESRRRFDKATNVYDQARERFMSLRKGTRADIVAELEEDLENSKSTFEKCRFNLVNTLMSIEAKKKYEFLESFSAIMDAHLRYFKQGYELLNQMEPFIHQVLTYAQQSKEMANIEQDKLAKRIQEFRTQSELESLRASSNIGVSTTGDYIRNVQSNKNIEALMQSTANGEVQTIKQGYLLKWSSSLRGDWKRRFFVLNSHGTLYYYRDKGTKPTGFQSLQSTATSEPGTGVFGRFRTRHQKAPSLSKENLGFRTVDLCVSTIKIDAEHTDLRLCFRIISPSKTYTLQAENEADRMDWVDKIRGVIASLLQSPFLEQHRAGREDAPVRGYAYGSGCDLSVGDAYRRLEDDTIKGQDDALRILREISGNDLCAECGAPDPDWASLNLGILLCIECSGAHRNLGVHISKVRSITLDVKVWESTVLDLFRGLGNAYCNSVWEEMLQHQHERTNESDSLLLITKPGPTDPVAKKEKYIHAKYVEKLFINREATDPEIPSSATRIWEAVKSKDIREVYHLIVASDANINTSYDEVNGCDLCHLLSAAEFQNELKTSDKSQYDPALCQRIKESNDLASCLQGWSLLHLACHDGDWVMVELLLLFGADINKCDFHGRTPLHHCVSRGNNSLAKYLLRRGARSSLKDGGGLTALERAMERGAITDERLFILLTERE